MNNPATAKERRCEEPTFDVFKKPRRIDEHSYEYSFCPGKATWYVEVVELFEQCRMALETGILPRSGSFEEQSELFVEVFPFFVQRWKSRTYSKIWSDVQSFTNVVLTAVLGKKSEK